jgi:hypothetical protein
MNQNMTFYESINLKDMTTEEKLQAMEMLWDDICRNIPDFSSPAWHEQILKEKRGRIKKR